MELLNQSLFRSLSCKQIVAKFNSIFSDPSVVSVLQTANTKSRGRKCFVTSRSFQIFIQLMAAQVRPSDVAVVELVWTILC